LIQTFALIEPGDDNTKDVKAIWRLPCINTKIKSPILVLLIKMRMMLATKIKRGDDIWTYLQLKLKAFWNSGVEDMN
jgi:hypothetical protein